MEISNSSKGYELTILEGCSLFMSSIQRIVFDSEDMYTIYDQLMSIWEYKGTHTFEQWRQTRLDILQSQGMPLERIIQISQTWHALF